MTTTTNTLGKSTLAAKISAVINLVLAANNVASDDAPAFGKFFRDQVAQLSGWRGNFPKPSASNQTQQGLEKYTDSTTECPEALVTQLGEYVYGWCLDVVDTMITDDAVRNVEKSKDKRMVIKPVDMGEITARPTNEEIRTVWDAAQGAQGATAKAVYEIKRPSFTFDPNLSV